MHLKAGEIRAYQDSELTPPERQRLQAHLESCQRCQALAENIAGVQLETEAKMALLAAGQQATHLSPRAAYARLAARRAALTQENQMTTNKKYTRNMRPAWIAILAVAILALALAFAPVRAIAESFLGLFRVQQIQVVPINPGNLPEQLGRSAQFEALLAEDVLFEAQGESQEVASPEQAASLAGIPVRLPQAISEQPTLAFQPGGSAVMTVSLKQLRDLLGEIGRADIQLPEELDGATLSLDVPAGVLAQYGACQFDLDQARQQGYDPDDQRIPRMPECTTLLQMPSPSITAPPGLDVQQIGEAYLQVMGLSREEAEQFASRIDWSSTFVIPIPRYATDYQEVNVDGVVGTLIMHDGQGPSDQYLLMWAREGIVYTLTGPGDAQTALNIAGSLK